VACDSGQSGWRQVNKRFLVLVTDAFGSPGGMAKFNRDLLNSLDSYPDCKSIVVLPMKIPGETGSIPARISYCKDGLNGKFPYIVSAIKAAWNNQFDLIICGHINLLPVAWITHILTRAPLVLIIHGIDAWQPSRSRLRNYFAKKIKFLISVSELTKNRFINWTAINNYKSFILPNSIALEKFGTGSKNPQLVYRYKLDNKRVLMTLGRLSAEERYKGIDEVLDVLPELTAIIPNLVYMVVGDGTDKPRLQDKVARLQLGEAVIFTGTVPEELKADYYRLADVFVMPGYGEGFGIVYLEAMACGIPVIASKIDASREALRGGDLGILVDPHNAIEIKQGILEALKKPKGIPEGLEYFSYANFEVRTHQLIDSIMTVNTHK